MKIDKSLNFVIPVDREDGTIYVHAQPVRREVFEQYFLAISKTFAAIYGEGLGPIAGPRVAAMMLKEVSVNAGLWDGPSGVENGLMNEIRRLSNVLVPGKNGWEMRPLQEALDSGLIDEDDASEVMNALVFFTVVSCMHKRTAREPILDGAGRMWGAEISSLSISDYAASLPTSTETVNSGETVITSSLPS